jgi:hypothetical protein
VHLQLACHPLVAAGCFFSFFSRCACANLRMHACTGQLAHGDTCRSTRCSGRRENWALPASNTITLAASHCAKCKKSNPPLRLVPTSHALICADDESKLLCSAQLWSRVLVVGTPSLRVHDTHKAPHQQRSSAPRATHHAPITDTSLNHRSLPHVPCMSMTCACRCDQETTSLGAHPWPTGGGSMGEAVHATFPKIIHMHTIRDAHA